MIITFSLVENPQRGKVHLHVLEEGAHSETKAGTYPLVELRGKVGPRTDGRTCSGKSPVSGWVRSEAPGKSGGDPFGDPKVVLTLTLCTCLCSYWVGLRFSTGPSVLGGWDCLIWLIFICENLANAWGVVGPP